MGRTPSVRGMGESSMAAGANMHMSICQPSSRGLLDSDSERVLGRPANAINPNDSGRIPDNATLMLTVNLTKKQQRLVDWNCELLQQIIRQIVARRNFLRNAPGLHLPFQAIKELPTIGGMLIQQGTSTMPLDEVVEVINLPEFEVAAYHANSDAKHIKLDPAVVAQLRRFISLIASRYRENPFHNFEQ